MTRTAHLADALLPMTGGPPIRDAGVVVDDGVVVAVGTAGALLREHPAARVRRWPGVMTPGLVNAHAHLEYGPAFADLATSGLPFSRWIQELTRRRYAMTEGDWHAAARGSVHAVLQGGTTCVGDVVTVGPAIAVAARAGLAGVSYVEVVGCDEARWPGEAERVQRLAAAAPAGRAVGLSPHSVYTLSGPVLTAAAELARTRGWRLHTHLAESADEAQYVVAGGGPIAEMLRRAGLQHELLDRGAGVSPAARVDELSGLGPDVHVAHGVHLDAADRALLRERSSSVALCVRSNRTLSAGTPPVAALLAEGSPVAVGTDSLASSPSLDLLAELAELRTVALAQGYEGDDLAERLVAAATVGGAAALGLAGRAGVIAEGVRADVAVFDVDPASPYEALVASGGSRCVLTLLGGRMVHRRSAVGTGS